ncbi:hypothetical protein C446_06140 [Halobiforma nitratireducens JCM 10879]|uniref:Uncharacterized protein n=1 Tax=Halobiforma nitratireducens JCM 10879 TaxID=1227454 RepID=M0M7B6_9EURY|nr:hypothetical protein C446_06140 [Halobiforma nitratireducens JCM 10879]
MFVVFGSTIGCVIRIAILIVGSYFSIGFSNIDYMFYAIIVNDAQTQQIVSFPCNFHIHSPLHAFEISSDLSRCSH